MTLFQVVALLNVFSSLAFYRSLQIGTVSIVSPIAAGYAVVIVLLSVFTGSSLDLKHTLGIGAALFGVVGASITFPRTSDHSPAGSPASPSRPSRLARWFPPP